MNGEARGFKEFGDCVVLYPDNYLNDIEGEKIEDECNEFLKRGDAKGYYRLCKYRSHQLHRDIHPGGDYGAGQEG